MWSSSRRDRCIRSALLIAVSILCISLVLISLAHRGTEQQVIGEILNGNSLLPERLIKEKCIPVCDSKDCVFQANMLLNSINPEVDPCENFQTFLCGTFEQRFGRDEHGYSGIGKAHLMMLKKMKDAIESIDAPPGSAFSKMKIVYDSCVNIGSSDLRGAKDFKQFLTDIEILNWPHLPEDFTFSEDGLPVLLGTLTSYLEAMFLTINIQSGNTEYPNETYVEVFFSPHFIEIPTTVQRDAAFEILKYFDIETEDIELILNDYNNVKSTLSNLADEITWEEDCKIVVIDCLRPGDKDLVDLCKAVDVFLNLTDLNGIITKPGISVREDNLLTVKKIISNLQSLPNRSVANFFALRLLWNHLDEINLFFRRKKLKYYQYFKREDRKKLEMANKNRWLYCVEWIEENMKLPLEKIYVEKYLEQSIIDEFYKSMDQSVLFFLYQYFQTLIFVIHDMHVNYTSEIADMFVQQEWIPMGIRTVFKMWIMNLKNSFSQLQELLPNETFLNDYMKLFYPQPASFFLNVMEDRKSKLRGYHLYKIDPNDLQTPSFKVNAAFSEDGGEIAYHYGIIFPPFHYPGHIRLINRILFAHIVVHEIGHGVVGLLTQISESTNSTKKTFLEKKHCIENQFSKFEFKYLGGNLNGTQYFDENLSDNLAQAFLDKLLQNFESSEDAISLPGLQYSPKQQLYMSSAEGFCSKSNLKIDILFKTEDVHAPLEYRIIGTMQNSREYAEAFQCPVGSYMNPAVKCSLFD